MTRPASPRRWIRPIRLTLYAALLVALFVGLREFSIVEVPPGPSPVFAYGAGQRLVISRGSAVERDDAVAYVDATGRIAIGRLVATGGDALEVDVEQGRVRRARDDVWYPAPERVIARIPLGANERLVLAENPLARDAGAVISPERVVGRVIAALPF